jgi:hypothetical protein
MPREHSALMSTPAAIPGGRRARRLSLNAAIFWIGILSLGGWAVIITVDLALV